MGGFRRWTIRGQMNNFGMRTLLRLFGAAALALAASTSGYAQTASPHAIDIPRWFVDSFLDFREDVADATRDRKRLLVYFGQDGCPYCKLLMQTTFADTRIVAKTTARFVPIALNLWGDREVTWVDGRRMTEKELGRLLQVQFTPTLLLFNEQGEVIGRLNGYQPPHRMEAALDYAAQRLEGKQPFAEYMRVSVREAASPTLHQQPYFARPPHDLQKGSQRPLLVLFERPNCLSCDELHRDGWQRPEVKAQVTRLTIVRLDSSSHTEVITPDGRRLTAADWARELSVAFAPTLVFFERGAEVFRVEAYVRPFHLSAALEYVASGAYRSEPSFQRYLQARAEGMRSRGEAVDLWK
jgi:thioredoxin-related protein